MALAFTLIEGTDTTAQAFNRVSKDVDSATFALNLGTYATDGIAVDADDVTDAIHGTCTSISAIIFHGPSPDGVHWASHNPTTEKILSWASSGTQTANSTDLSTDAKKLHCTVLFT